MYQKKLTSAILCLLFTCNNVFALNAASDLIEHTSGVNPTTSGNVTNITTTHNIDTYHWSSFNIAGNETANFIFGANGQTALNYLSPGANASAIYGSIMSSGAKGNILLFNPNGIMMGAGASVSGANTFFASTNKFDGIVDGKVTFSEAEKNNPLTIGNIKFNDVNNVHFVAPNVIVNADNLTTSNSISFRAIGGGEYDINANLFSNKIGVKNPITNTNMLDVNANITSNKVTIDAKADADIYATALVSGDIKANKTVKGENGEIYIVASNDNNSSTASMQVVQNATLSGDGAKVDINTQNLVQNGNIDVSSKTGGGEINLVATDTIKQDGTLKANCAGENGNGGNINLFANKTADISGTIEAKKGSSSGTGGNVEISTLGQLILDASVNTTGGFLTIDPTDIDINIKIDASGIKYTPTYVQDLLANNNVSFFAHNDITVSSPLTWTNGNSLTLDAGRNITINAGITSAIGNLSLIANDIDNPDIILSERGAGPGGITTASGATIGLGTGNLSFLTKETGATYLAGDTYIGSNINANNFTVTNNGIGKDIIIASNLLTTGKTTLTANNISITNTNPAISYGGFDLEAQGSVSTNDLKTTDGTTTYSGSDVTINANKGGQNGTFIETGAINAGLDTSNITIYLGNTPGNTNGSITIGDMTSGVNTRMFDIDIDDENDSATSKLKINSINSQGVVYAFAKDITLTNASYAYSGFRFESDGSFTSSDLETSEGGACWILTNASGQSPLSYLNVGNITASTGKLSEVKIIAGSEVGATNTVAHISVKNIDADDIRIDNQNEDASGISDITLSGDLTATGDITIEAPLIKTTNTPNITTSGGSIIFANSDGDPGGNFGAGSLSLVTDTLNISNTIGGFITNLSYQPYTPATAISSTQIASLLTNISVTNLNLGSTSQIGDIGDSTAINFKDTIVSATTTGNVYFNALNDLNIGTIIAYDGIDLEAQKSVSTGDLITTDGLTHTGGNVTINANKGGLNGTFIKTGDINAGKDSGIVNINLANTNNNTNGSITTGYIVAGDAPGVNGIEVNDDNSSPTSRVFINYINTPSSVELSGNNIVINSNSYADYGFKIFANGGVSTASLSTTDSIVWIFANRDPNAGVNSSVSTGDITTGDANVTITMNDNGDYATISVGKITASSISLLNQNGSSSSTINLLGDLSVIGGSITVAAPIIKANNSKITADNLIIGSDNLSIASTTKGAVTNLQYETYSNNTNISNAKLASLFTALSATNATLGSTGQIGDVGDSTATTVDFGDTIITAVTKSGSIDLNAKNNITLHSVSAPGGTATIKAAGKILADTNVVGRVGINGDNGISFISGLQDIEILPYTGSETDFNASINGLNVQKFKTNSTSKIYLEAGDLNSLIVNNSYNNPNLQYLGLAGGTIKMADVDTRIDISTSTIQNPAIYLLWKSSTSPHMIKDTTTWSQDNKLIADNFGTTQLIKVETNNSDLYYNVADTREPISYQADNGYRVIAEGGPTPTPSGGGSSSGTGGAIAGGTIGGVAAAGVAGGAYGLGLLPGLLLGLASPIQFDETMIDIIDQSRQAYPLLVRNMQYVYQTDDISKLDSNKIGSAKYIPDQSINNGSYELVKVQIPPQFANAPKGVTVKITQKSNPFGISKSIPDMNFNVFNTLSDKQISSLYQTRKFLKTKYFSNKIATLKTSQVEANNGIIQKTLLVKQGEIKNNLSITVNYLKNGQFPRKNSNLKLDKQSYSLVVQFLENK